jgi:hypothetical protein
MKLNPAIIFFPGMILHEISHYIACIILRVKVHKVKLFDLNTAFVIHDKTNAWKAIIITLAPFLLNNLLGLELLNFGLRLAETQILLSVLFFWFSVSLFYFCFPSLQDAKNAFNSTIEFYDQRVFHKGNIFQKLFWLITFPFIFIPLIIVLAIMLAFHYSFILRILWIIFMLFFALNPASALETVSSLNQSILELFS